MISLDDVVELLDQHRQRATYGAVAHVAGGDPRGIMKGIPRSQRYSWVVAKNDRESKDPKKPSARRGFPTGYSESQLHPDLLQHEKVIETKEELCQWIRARGRDV